MLRKEHLMCDDSISLCPTIYQEHVEGYQHIRAHCFGDNVYAAVLESNELDWRSNLDVPFRIADVDVDLKDKLLKVTRALGLRMGIFDLKYIDKSISPIWLEINPQGQFLFLEGLSGMNLTEYFAQFLYNEAVTKTLGKRTSSS
jgi:hypothetical protein